MEVSSRDSYIFHIYVLLRPLLGLRLQWYFQFSNEYKIVHRGIETKPNWTKFKLKLDLCDKYNLIRNNSRRKYKNFLYDHFINYHHSIENVTITPLEILSKKPGDSKNDMKKRRLSAELSWIKRLQTPYPLGPNDQIYQQRNISSVRSHINVFSLKQYVHRKRRSHGVRRNGPSRRKQRLNRSLDDLLRIAPQK